ISAIAPPNTKIVGMSHDSWETLTISEDGKTADVTVTATVSVDPWQAFRTITVIVDNDESLNDTLVGSLTYYSATDVKFCNCALEILTKVVKITPGVGGDGFEPNVHPGKKVVVGFSLNMFLSPALKIPGSRIHIIAPSKMKFVTMNIDIEEKLTISGDGKTADLTITNFGGQRWRSERFMTLSADIDIPLDQRFRGSWQFITSIDNAGPEFEYSVNTLDYEISVQPPVVYATPGATVTLPFQLSSASDKPATPGSSLWGQTFGSMKVT